jgi:1,4-alpha-glucan branching enzyme
LVSTTWYEWNDKEWMENRWKKNTLNAPMSVYELHLGSWVREGNDPKKFLNYRDIGKNWFLILKKWALPM